MVNVLMFVAFMLGCDEAAEVIKIMVILFFINY